MFDMRPVGYVIGLLVAALGAMMIIPMAADFMQGDPHWMIFLEAAIITVFTGGLVSLACSNSGGKGLTIQQTFILTTGVWVALPIFGALPFMLGATEASFTDAFFEAMSGLTTTGATVFSGLDGLPQGINLWRAILQWLGGVGIIVVAMVFLPELKVGGMQIFRSEGFDTFGKILPRATEISRSISTIYIGITAAAIVAYLASGLRTYDAVIHAMTTVSTGGFSNHDASFGALPPAAEYVAVIFMLAAALPFVRYVQIVAGDNSALLRDSQVRSFLMTLCVIAAAMVVWLWVRDGLSEQAFRQAIFNTTSILTGTGYASTDYMEWGSFAISLFFLMGLIGGCAGSTTCSIKIFRFQLLFASVRAQINQIHSPHGVFTPRYEGRSISEEVVNSVMAFFMLFIVTLGIIAVLLGMTGLDFVTSVSGAAATLANIGPGLGDVIGPAGNYATVNDTAKWVMTFAMLIGRLELVVVFVLLTIRFWRE
ncbi:TrkH family potassium uptake protein [Nereida sp. MMG025]|uniref:TrkH family potassium uptake protein n=1 Tax=Nereida sp. MMG025 TaxID=2909981 RepID=UPI001F470E87|nr:TrkH family potassium uptake protein [Nereida sp. MMG025]MCF6443796.1 TrkH family potassium uptake protein [Nereida sp. MMG025]